jgi:hypothetical protein
VTELARDYGVGIECCIHEMTLLGRPSQKLSGEDNNIIALQKKKKKGSVGCYIQCISGRVFCEFARFS